MQRPYLKKIAKVLYMIPELIKNDENFIILKSQAIYLKGLNHYNLVD